MIKTASEIQASVDGGEISAITLDTSVFDAQQRGLEHGLLKRLSQFKGSDNKLLLSDVVLREVERHLKSDAEEALTAVRRATSLINRSWRNELAKDFGTVSQAVLSTEVASLAGTRLGAFCEVSGVVEVKAGEHVKTGDVINRYFASQPPFGTSENKKYEFPDAFALLALESWAQKADTHVLVVTKDGDWTSYCAQSERLVAIDDLSGALGCFQKETARYACQLFLELCRREDDPLDFNKSLLAALNDQAVEVIDIDVDADSQFSYYEDIVEMAFSGFELPSEPDCNAEPVDYDDGFVVVSLNVFASAEIKCHFGFEKWDSIDREYMGMGSGSASANEVVALEVLVTLTGEIPQKMEIESVEVLPRHLHLDLGEIEPAWMSDPSSFE